MNNLRTGRFLTLVAATFVLSACGVTFDHNVSGDRVDPEPYIGDWNLVELLNVAPAVPTTIQFDVNVDGELIVRASDTSGTREATATLTAIDGATILSIKNRNDSWQIYKISFIDNGRRLAVQLPSFGVLRADVLAGVIDGEVRQVDLDEDDLVVIRADSVSLSGYIAAKPALFQNTGAILERNDPGTSVKE